MGKADTYRQHLSGLLDWEPYLLKESGLPGPRANLELVQAAADLGRPEQFTQWAALDPAAAPVNTPPVFLAVCGIVGLGRLLAEGDQAVLPTLRRLAGDPRWRVREAVAMALQRWGDVDMPALLAEMAKWATGGWLEQRAVAAALCEPRLLVKPAHMRRVLKLLDGITAAVTRAGPAERKTEPFKSLRQGLGYCWSVAVAALPEAGQPAMEKWLLNADPDVRWIMRENLKKARLARMDAAWVERWQKTIP
jgi:hypothetical protein